MKYYRVVIETIQPGLPTKLTLDERVLLQTPVSGWHDIVDAHQLAMWLRTNRPILLDGKGGILIYALQEAEWEGTPPPPVPFDEAAVASFPAFTSKLADKAGAK